jgi:catechol 2,3-dioxygenase-like lactoylglutathione lyase family enzyme
LRFAALEAAMAQIGVRYIVDSVDKALPFYTDLLGFKVDFHPARGFAALSHGDLRLFLNEPGAGSAGQNDDAGKAPSPGGWNRFQLVVDDLDPIVAKLRSGGAKIRTSVAQGPGGRQALVDDPAGNAIELFEPKRERPN